MFNALLDLFLLDLSEKILHLYGDYLHDDAYLVWPHAELHFVEWLCHLLEIFLNPLDLPL